ncbi:MAG: peptidyl-prolyl cis-trans isomerase [Desulfobacterales bacterium]|nr:peptidyl-prolyl cis-trans isomerase [Desulfobacterales bacterium]
MMRKIVREPLLHFLTIGAALFLYFHWSGGGSGPTSDRIVLTAGQIGHLAAGFAKTWQRPPTEVEIKGLIDDWIREEIAVREAMASGLDRDDTIIRRRLRQKLEFLFEEVDAAVPPSDRELQAWLTENADLYRLEPQVSFRQIYLSRERRGSATEDDARTLLARLRAAGPDTPIDHLGHPTLLPREVEMSSLAEVARTFGQEFSRSTEALPVGVWSGPIQSGFGLHLVWVRARVAGSLPDLAQVRLAVERDFTADRRRRQLAAMYERLLAKYRVVIERKAADDDGGKSGANAS